MNTQQFIDGGGETDFQNFMNGRGINSSPVYRKQHKKIFLTDWINSMRSDDERKKYGLDRPNNWWNDTGYRDFNQAKMSWDQWQSSGKAWTSYTDWINKTIDRRIAADNAREAAQQAEIARQAEILRQEEAARQAEIARQAEAARQASAAAAAAVAAAAAKAAADKAAADKAAADKAAADKAAADKAAADKAAADIAAARTSAPRISDPITSDPRTSAPRISDPRTSAPRISDPRTSDPRTSDPRTSAPRISDPRTSDPRTSAARHSYDVVPSCPDKGSKSRPPPCWMTLQKDEYIGNLSEYSKDDYILKTKIVSNVCPRYPFDAFSKKSESMPSHANTIEPSIDSSKGITLGPSRGSGPSIGPRIDPSIGPIIGATMGPSIGATMGPSIGATMGPSIGATMGPSMGPSIGATMGPSIGATMGPSMGPSIRATMGPSMGPRPTSTTMPMGYSTGQSSSSTWIQNNNNSQNNWTQNNNNSQNNWAQKTNLSTSGTRGPSTLDSNTTLGDNSFQHIQSGYTMGQPAASNNPYIPQDNLITGSYLYNNPENTIFSPQKPSVPIPANAGQLSNGPSVLGNPPWNFMNRASNLNEPEPLLDDFPTQF